LAGLYVVISELHDCFWLHLASAHALYVLPQVKADPDALATAQDAVVKSETAQQHHDGDDVTDSEGDSDEDSDYEVSH